MMPNVSPLAQLLCSAQREESGSLASDRFDYQKDWALLRLLALHAAEGDYVLLCEFHEDIAVVDSAHAPSHAIFYQIKTDATRRWTTQRLLAKKKGKGGSALPSILGKLCEKAAHVGEGQVAFHFVTNSGFSVRDSSGKSAYLDAPGEYLASTTLSAAEWQEISDALKAETGLDLGEPLAKSLHLSIADLPLRMHHDTALGLVAKFLDEQAPGVTIAPTAFYRALFDELRRRTTAAVPNGPLDERCRVKGIDRTAFERMLHSAIKAAPERGSWTAVRQELQREGVPLLERLALDEARKRVYLRWLRPSDSALRRARRLLILETKRALETGTATSLYSAAAAGLSAAKTNDSYASAGLSDTEAIAIAMEGLYEGTDDQVSSLNKQSAEEDA